jgi:hypothetical protein
MNCMESFKKLMLLMLIGKINMFCWLFGHTIYVEDMGGTLIECCECCNWVGRYVNYDIEVKHERDPDKERKTSEGT